MSVFIPPRFDRMFKKVFANPHAPAPLRSFLGGVLNVPKEDLAELRLVDSHTRPTQADGKESIVDVRIKTARGRDIDIEIQLANEPGFHERLVYYTAGMLANQLPAGAAYSTLSQAITIVITGFRVIPAPDNAFRHRFHLYDPDHQVGFSDILELNTLELPKLPQIDDGTLLWKWLRFIAARTPEELHMTATLDPVIADAAAEVERFNHDRYLQFVYLEQDRRERDRISRELDERERKAALDERTATLDERTATLDERTATLDEQEQTLGEQERTLGERTAALNEQDRTLKNLEHILSEREAKLREREATLRAAEIASGA